MSCIDCSVVIKIPVAQEEYSEQDPILEILSFITTVPVQAYNLELIKMRRSEDTINEIPSSFIEISHHNKQWYELSRFVKHKGRLQKREDIEISTVCISKVNEKPIEFFQAAGFEIIHQSTRETHVGVYEGISIYGFLADRIIEASLECQLAELEESVEKLRELIKMINEFN